MFNEHLVIHSNVRGDKIRSILKDKCVLKMMFKGLVLRLKKEETAYSKRFRRKF